MTEPLKPRIDFTGQLEQSPHEAFKTAQTFSGPQADNFAPVLADEPMVEEGQAEAVVDAALRPKRSLWRKMVTAGLALFGVSVIGQGVQWGVNAWQTQDWVALGGCAAGALIVGAGVGSVVTEWRRLWRLRQRAHERDEARDLLHSHGTGKGRAFCEKLAAQAGIDHSHPALQRWYAAIHETQNDQEVVTLYAHIVQPVLDAQARREISRQSAGDGGHGLYRLAQPASDQPYRQTVWHRAWLLQPTAPVQTGIAEYRLRRGKRTGTGGRDGLDVAGSCGASLCPGGAGDWCRSADGTPGHQSDGGLSSTPLDRWR